MHTPYPLFYLLVKLQSRTHLLLGLLLVAVLFCGCNKCSMFSKQQVAAVQFDGIDVSHYQGSINWETLREYDNIRFVYIKATEGITHTDPCYAQNAQTAHDAGFLIGSYHYLSMTSPVSKQFEHFRQTTQSFHQDLLPMLDVELKEGFSKQAVQDSVMAFAGLVRKHYGRYPVIYSVQGCYNTYLAPEFNDFVLYLGRYKCEMPVVYDHNRKLISSKTAIWQFSEKGRLKGIERNVDLCRFVNDHSLDDLLVPAKNK